MDSVMSGRLGVADEEALAPPTVRPLEGPERYLSPLGVARFALLGEGSRDEVVERGMPLERRRPICLRINTKSLLGISIDNEGLVFTYRSLTLRPRRVVVGVVQP